MRVLIICERSGTVRRAFRKRGHDAYSCDLVLADDGDQEHHLRMDCIDALFNYKPWDLVIMHPPCTCIALCGNSTYGRGMAKHDKRLESIDWTKRLWRLASTNFSRVGMENPKNVMTPHIGPPTQKIHPWQFGHPEQKETWLWLHGLPSLAETNNVHDAMMRLPKRERERECTGWAGPPNAAGFAASPTKELPKQWLSNGADDYAYRIRRYGRHYY